LVSFRENTREEKIDITYRVIANYGIPTPELGCDSRLTGFVSASFGHEDDNNSQNSFVSNEMDTLLLPIIAIRMFSKFTWSNYYRAWRNTELET